MRKEEIEVFTFAELSDDAKDTAGDWLRRKFRAEFGSALQRRWFD